MLFLAQCTMLRRCKHHRRKRPGIPVESARRDILAVALVLEDPRSSAACLLASNYGMAPRNHSPKHKFCQAFLSGRIRVSVQSVGPLLALPR